MIDTKERFATLLFTIENFGIYEYLNVSKQTYDVILFQTVS